MMPGNNGAPETPTDSDGNATNGDASVTTDDTNLSAENPATQPGQDNQQQAQDPIDSEAISPDGTEADPLGFGDQRMGSDAANAEHTEEPLDEVSALQGKLAEAEAKASENWDRLLRLQAEMENQRKRAQNDVNKARKFALEAIVGDLLPVKDSLEMGLAAAQTDDADQQSIVEGAELTLKMLSQVFEKNNIVEVNPLDEKFDPEFHQAMSMQVIEGKEPNTVTNVMQRGYTLNDRLVRPALVMVAK